MQTVSIDFETRGTEDLRKTGAYRYAQHRHTDVWCMAYAFDDEEPKIWLPGDVLDPDLVLHIQQGGALRAWNAQFERTIWNNIMAPRYGWPETTARQWYCTAAEARAVGLPGSLDEAAKALSTEHQKDKEGASLMLRMAKPRSWDQNAEPVWWNVPDRVKKLVSYCLQDVRTERDIKKNIPNLGRLEREVFLLDQAINDRGVQLDFDLATAAQDVAKKAAEIAAGQMWEATGGAVSSATESGRLLAWLKSQGVEADAVDKVTVRELRSGQHSNLVQRALELRAEYGKSSVAKVASMLNSVCDDHRIRGLLLYHGAATGRWAGRLVQPQNFPRGEVSEPERFIPYVMRGDVELIEMMAPAMEVISSLLRAMLTAKPGHKLVCADYSAIEARVLAWLAGEEELLQTFRTGGDVYKVMASKIYSVDVKDVTKAQRQMGKMAILGLGYGMGFKKFIDACKTMANITIDEETAREVVTLYRNANKGITTLWSNLNVNALAAVREPGRVFGTAGCKFAVKGQWLWIVLPSGRRLGYHKPRLVMRQTPWGSESEAVQFDTVNSVTRKWVPSELYGGLITENIVQAVARDLLAEAMLRVEDNGYPVVMSVHDEIVAEVPEDFGSVAEFEVLMAEAPAWAQGCPVGAEGWEGPRYKK